MSEHADVGRQPSVLRAVGAITANLVWEAVTRPVARAANETPRRIEAVTPEWMTHALCKQAPGAEVTAISFGAGSSGTSVRRQIGITYNDVGRLAGLPTSVFAKSTPTLLTRLANGFSGTTATEAKFYSSLRPQLTLEAPVGYHSSYDPKSYRSIHLLEDLVATKRARFCTPRTYINRDQANEVVDILAALHAHFYDDPRIGSEYSWLKTYPQWFLDGLAWADLQTNHEKAMTRAGDVIPKDVLARRGDIWPALMRSLDTHAQHPSTVLHSDVHLGNWYITGDDRMGLCDWQCVNTGLWARDFAYAVSATLTVEDRRAWEKDLLKRYLETMHARTGRAFDFDEGWNLYRQQLFSALLMWTPTLCHPPMLPDMQPEDICFEMIKRMTTAISDLGSLDAFGKT